MILSCPLTCPCDPKHFGALLNIFLNFNSIYILYIVYWIVKCLISFCYLLISVSLKKTVRCKITLLLKIFVTVLSCDGQIHLPLLTERVRHAVMVIIM